MRTLIALAIGFAAAGQASAGVLPHPPPVAHGILAAQAGADTPGAAPQGAPPPPARGVTPQIEAEVRGQTTTFAKPLTPVAPVAPQPPRGPVKLLVNPRAGAGGIQGPVGPQGPAGLPR